MKKVHLSRMMTIISGISVFQAGCTASEANGPSDQLNARQFSSPSLDVSGRYSGTAGNRSAGLLLSPLTDNTYTAVVIVYTDLLKDNLLGNLSNRVDRVVERIALYRAVPIGNDELTYQFQPLTIQNGIATSITSSGELSVLSITDRGEALRPVGPFRPNEKQPPARFSATLSAAESGEKTTINFDSFLRGAKEPTSTWDKDFVANTWEDSYVFAKSQAKTSKEGGKSLLTITEPGSFAGKFEMKTVTLKTASGSQKVHGLYSMNSTEKSATNKLSDRLGIFIDVVNRKPLFNTRELFLINQKSGESFSESNSNGFVMYFEKGGLF
jgi:hypothetical protein